jgi:DNA-binding transcriptional regulator GbsR (MarR family)
MDEKTQKIIDEFVEMIGHLGSKIGLSKVACQLYALLFIKGKPLSLDEMMEYLKMSKGNISINIRALENWGAVKKVWKKGSRKDFYQSEEDIPKIVITRLREGLDKRLGLIKEFIEKRGTKSDIKQIKKLEKLVSQAETALKFLERENIRLFFP